DLDRGGGVEVVPELVQPRAHAPEAVHGRPGHQHEGDERRPDATYQRATHRGHGDHPEERGDHPQLAEEVVRDLRHADVVVQQVDLGDVTGDAGGVDDHAQPLRVLHA